jgi:hypothetical protein
MSATAATPPYLQLNQLMAPAGCLWMGQEQHHQLQQQQQQAQVTEQQQQEEEEQQQQQQQVVVVLVGQGRMVPSAAAGAGRPLRALP